MREEGAFEKRIKADTVTALRGGDKERVAALRQLTAALKKARIDANKEPSEADELVVLKRERKRRLEAIEIYEQAGRDELVARESFEEGVLATYLPEDLSEDDLGRLVDEAIAETGAQTPTDMGKVMGVVMKKVAGRADGTQVNRMVRARLGA
jgi:hypothetical protein